MLSDPFLGMGAQRNSSETQQSGHAPVFGPEVKNLRIKEGCDRVSEVGTVQSGRDGEEPFTLRKPKVSGRRKNCEKDFVSKQNSGYVLS